MKILNPIKYTKSSKRRWEEEKSEHLTICKRPKVLIRFNPERPIRIVMRFDELLIGAVFYKSINSTNSLVKISEFRACLQTKTKEKVSRVYFKFNPYKIVYRSKYKQVVKPKKKYKNKKKKVIYVPIEKDYSLF